MTSTTVSDDSLTVGRETTDVDVVICTRNRSENIESAVTSVLNNTYPTFRLTVIDQSTTDATELVLAPLVEADPRLRYVHVDEAGLSRAYNTGIGATTADILAFTDDDCLVPDNWIAAIAAAFDAEPDGDLLYGNVVAFESGSESGLTPTLIVDRPERLSRKDGFRVFGMGANFAARRRLFASVGGFDEVLGGGGPLRSSQDFDLAYRVFRNDSVILLRPEVTIRHDGRREPEQWPALLEAYGTGDGAFYMKHVRCRDVYATWLLAKRLCEVIAKIVVKSVVRRSKPAEVHYLKGMVAGMRGSFGFKVDAGRRLYVNKQDLGRG
jgi:glycosyltransferase involved in cell wall biosynthesis